MVADKSAVEGMIDYLENKSAPNKTCASLPVMCWFVNFKESFVCSGQ
jgi:hypothetical protein